MESKIKLLLIIVIIIIIVFIIAHSKGRSPKCRRSNLRHESEDETENSRHIVNMTSCEHYSRRRQRKHEIHSNSSDDTNDNKNNGISNEEIANIVNFDPPLNSCSGFVFVATNGRNIRNSVHMLKQQSNGSLVEVANSPFNVSSAAGVGSGGGEPLPGDPLGSQSSLITDFTNNYLFVTNAGGNSVSSFKINNNSLTAVNTVSSGGNYPVSLANWGPFVYVVNGGLSASIQGYIINYFNNGSLVPLPGTNLTLPSPNTHPLGIDGYPSNTQSPGQILFSPSGKWLIIIAKDSIPLASQPPPGATTPGRIIIYRIVLGFPVGSPTVFTLPLANCPPCSGGGFPRMPFSMAFTQNGKYAVLTEIFGNDVSGNVGPGFMNSAMSSLAFNDITGTFSFITQSIPSHGEAICWCIMSNSGDVYSTQNFSDDISHYRISSNGTLSIINQQAGIVGPGFALGGTFPTDLQFSCDGKYIYVLTIGSGNTGITSALIWTFKINSDTSLTLLGNVAIDPTKGVFYGQFGMATI